MFRTTLLLFAIIGVLSATAAVPLDRPRSQVCPENQRWTICGGCQLTCKDRNSTRVCRANCLPNGCQCKGGYFLNDAGSCVLPSEC